MKIPINIRLLALFYKPVLILNSFGIFTFRFQLNHTIYCWVLNPSDKTILYNIKCVQLMLLYHLNNE